MCQLSPIEAISENIVVWDVLDEEQLPRENGEPTRTTPLGDWFRADDRQMEAETAGGISISWGVSREWRTLVERNLKPAGMREI